MAEKILFQTKLTEQSTSDIEGEGTIRRDEYGNVFKWVQNAEASTVTATLSGLSSYNIDSDKKTVKIPAAATLANSAGFWMSAVVGQSYGWIQCQGTGPGLVIRSGSAASITVTSSAAMLSAYIPVTAKEYVTQGTLALHDKVLSPVSLASLASTGVGSGSISLVFAFKL